MIESRWLWFTLLPVLGYLVGSIPFGVLLASAHGVDLRKVGSGNVGATNVGRALGTPWGYACFFLDCGKGFAPAFAGPWLLGIAGLPTLLQQGAWLALGMSAILGHVFPVWLRFGGGKGVATSLGVVLGMWPIFTSPGLASFGLWLAVTLLSRYVSLGSVVATVGFLGFFIAFNADRLGQLWLMGLFASAIVVLVVWRHRGNLRRLLAGTENRIGTRRE
jgi:acyl phosphate:glycerol-3-phosphate acyltransferase